MGAARVHKGRARCAFTRSLFVCAASRAERGGEEADLSRCGRLLRLYKLRAQVWFVKRVGFRASCQRRTAESRGAMETSERSDCGAGECARRDQRLPGFPDCPTRLVGADSGYSVSAPPCTPLPHLSRPRFPSSSSPLSTLRPRPKPLAQTQLRPVLPSLGSRPVWAPLLPTPQIRRLLETLG